MKMRTALRNLNFADVAATGTGAQAVVSQDHPLEVRSAGKTTATLPTASAIAWTKAAVQPQG